MTAYTFDDKLKCIVRELALRAHVYPRFIDSGRLKKADADREMDIMRAIREDYQRAVDREKAKNAPQLPVG